MKRSNWIFQLNFSHGLKLSHYLPCTNHFCQLIRFFYVYHIVPIEFIIRLSVFFLFIFFCGRLCKCMFVIISSFSFLYFHFHVCARCHWAMTMRANGIFNIRIVIACVNDEKANEFDRFIRKKSAFHCCWRNIEEINWRKYLMIDWIRVNLFQTTLYATFDELSFQIDGIPS